MQINCSSIFFSRSQSKIWLSFDWRVDRNQSSTTNTQLKMKISIKFFIFFTIFSKNDWFFIQIFKTFRFFVKIRIVIAQWRRIWMSIHHRIFVWFEQFNLTILFVFSLTNNLFNKFWKFQFVFLFCLSFFVLIRRF